MPEEEIINEEEAKKLLSSYGISAKRGDNGTFRVTPGVYKQVSMKVVTGKVKTAYILPTKPLYMLETVRPMFLPLPCIFGFEPWCWVRKYKDPEIDFGINAVKVRDVDVYLLRGRITGKIDTKFENMSKEGETWEENVKTGEQRNRENVDGSADLDGKFDEEIFMRKISETLAKIEDRFIKKTEPDAKIKITSDFEKKGYLNMIKSILDILLTGSMYIDDKIKVTVEWSWLGEKKSKSKDISIRAYLPVENVNWHMW